MSDTRPANSKIRDIFARRSVAARSALMSGTIVLVALLITGTGLTALLNQSLISGIDAAAAARLGDVVAGLDEDVPARLDAPLFIGVFPLNEPNQF